MRTSVRRTTASSQTTTGTTRTTSSSQCTTSTPMTTLTSKIAWCTSCIELAHSAHCSTLDDDTAHLMALVLSPFRVIYGHTHGRVVSDSTSPFFLYLFFLPFSVFLFHLELFLELDNPIVMESLRCSAAEESEDTLNAFHSHTGYEPNFLTFGELNDSSVPFSFMIPSSDQDVDDLTLGEMLTAAHRGQVDYCVPGGMSVSQSS